MTSKKHLSIRALSLVLAFSAGLFCMPVAVQGETADAAPVTQTETADTAPKTEKLPDYEEYRDRIGAVPAATGDIVIEGKTYADSAGTVSVEADGSLLTGSDSTVTWSFEVPSTGFYQLQVTYFPTVSKGGQIERTLYIDGAVPFDEARYIEFSRVYVDGEITVNSRDNEVTPEQIEQPEARVYTFRDADSFVSEDLAVYLTAGTHTVSLEANKEKLQIFKLHFYPERSLISYEEYRKQHGTDPAEQDAEVLTVEAEKPLKKSTFTIYPTADKSSSATTPQHPIKTRLNMISGDKWSKVGQWLTWEIEVEKSGYYMIAPRYKQDAYAGGFVSRRLYIDGEIPFAQAQALRFDYTTSWKVTPVGGEEPYLFYLSKGTHNISMEVVLGDMSGIIAEIKASLDSLNADYRRILMLTGPSPDIYRDYGYEKLIPDVLADLTAQAENLQNAIDELRDKSDVKGDFTNSVNKLIIVLRQIEKDPEVISELFGTYKDNLSSLGTWLQSIMVQPLDVDRIYVVPEQVKVPASGDHFFSNLVFKIKRFFLSFAENYQSFATEIKPEDYEQDKVVTVWMTTGREQAQIMQKLTEQYWTPQTGLKANVQLVTATALLPSALAGTGPDVAMNVPSHTPIDFAIRKAAVDLSTMRGFDEVTKRFHPAALVPFNFEGSVYAIPETMTFLMMFYRTDVLEELGLKAPTTWDEFYEVVWELQQQNLDVGYPINAKTSVVNNNNLYGLELFLYQNGGELYNEKHTASAMSEDLNVEAFERMAELFTLYKFPVDYDFANRFRSGEMPLGIVEYTMYNQLTIFASEIKGLWAMAPVPGTVLPDGSINNTSPAAASGIMMLASAKNYENSWKFIDWVTTTDAQSRYAVEVESVLGVAAKQATSNVAAMESMSWTDAEYNALQTQIAALKGTPEIPGGYYTARAIDFAFANVYTSGKDPATSILAQVEILNEEITRKRKEFGLNTD